MKQSVNKSLEYIKSRIESGNVKNINAEEFSDMGVVPFNTLLDQNEKETIPIYTGKESGIIYVDLTYDPNVDFDYFCTQSCYCDGTLMFMYELMLNIIEKIQELKTSLSSTVEKYPEGIDFEKHRIHYIVGDFVTNSYIVDESPDPEKPWMRDHFTVMLPIKFEIEEIENELH